MASRSPQRPQSLIRRFSIPASALGLLLSTATVTLVSLEKTREAQARTMDDGTSPSARPRQPSSLYGDISLADWQWARAQAVNDALAQKQFRDSGGDVNVWARAQPILYNVTMPANRLLIIDLGHSDRTEGENSSAPGAQARNGRTEADFVDIQGRALYAEAKRQGYRVVFIRAPDEIMDVPEFRGFSMEDRKSYYARTRGAQIDRIAERLGYSPANTRAVSLHMDRSGVLFNTENASLLHGTAIYVNADSVFSVDFARAMANGIPNVSIAPYARSQNGIQYTRTLALPKGAENIPTILYESNFMTDQPQAVEFRAQVLRDYGRTWAQNFMNGIDQSFPVTMRSRNSQIASAETGNNGPTRGLR